MNSRTGTVDVVYALPDTQVVVAVECSPGLTAAMAVQRSGLIEQFPEIGTRELVLGIWGAPVSSGQVLCPGDRVEISRPLVADPREMRRDLLSTGRVMGGASAAEAGIRKGSS